MGSAFRAIASGEMELAIAGGVESMSRAPFVMGKADTAFGRSQKLEDTTMGWRFVNPLMKAQYGVEAMPQTGDNVAEDYRHLPCGSGRVRPAQPAAHGRGSGRRASSLRRSCPCASPTRKARPSSTATNTRVPTPALKRSAKLKPVNGLDKTVTAGNASGVNDGAAAMILASAEAVKKHGLTPRARVLGMASAGVAPRVMGIGPVPAVRKLVRTAGAGGQRFRRH